jgi:hypothetical protein
LRRLNLALRNALISEVTPLANKVETAQKALDNVLEKIVQDTPDYVALRRSTAIKLSEVKNLIMITPHISV